MSTKEQNEWRLRHLAAMTSPNPKSFESALVQMLRGAELYAELHSKRYDSVIGNDGVLGPAFEDVARGIRTLLNGETGPRLDCGSFDSELVDLLDENGFDSEK